MELKRYPDFEAFRQMCSEGNLIPVCADILADSETPVSLLARVYDGREPVFLLESVEGGERWGRYSFLGVGAKLSARIFKETIKVEEGASEQVVSHGGDPLGVLRSLMAPYRPVSVAGLPRFWGGLVGYVSYEAVSFFERIPNQCGPDDLLAHFVIPEQLFIFDNLRHTLTLVACAFTEGKTPDAAFREAQNTLEVMRRTLDRPAERTSDMKGLPLNLETPLDPEAFRSQVSRIKDYIGAGDVIQAVLSQAFVCSPPPHPVALYRAQRYINPSPYLYFLHLDGTVLVGSSPETMVRLEHGVATLRPIAGTRPRGGSEAEDRRLADELLRDPKERAEHLMLVDLGRNDLGRVAEVGSVQVTDLMVVERYSHVMHLVSNITCDLKRGLDAWDLLRATFPAGTLSGAPKIRAMEIIAELEDEPRGPYGGAIGYVSFTGNMDLAITIRTACFQNGRLTVRAGAGIVADSDPERERQETVNKAMAIQRALELLKQANGE